MNTRILNSNFSREMSTLTRLFLHPEFDIELKTKNGLRIETYANAIAPVAYGALCGPEAPRQTQKGQPVLTWKYLRPLHNLDHLLAS